MKRDYYSDSLIHFLTASSQMILGELSKNNEFSLEQTQRDAWLKEIAILQQALAGKAGKIYFEYAIPRMGKRIDVVCIIGAVIYIIEFKVGEKTYLSTAVDQVEDYALDLMYFHETSHDKTIAPILVATDGPAFEFSYKYTNSLDKLLKVNKCNATTLKSTIDNILSKTNEVSIISEVWETGRYNPTPTIIEAAMALYNGHSVKEISRSDASAINLGDTSNVISEIIKNSCERNEKSLCFVTGVPGAGKTLVGLNIATNHINKESDLYSVFLSGNGPLVDILREALAMDKVRFDQLKGKNTKKGEARREVQLFIQNVHNFRDECLIDTEKPPLEHVALFDEAQRAWDLPQTTNFMKRRKGIPDFNISEPEYLISCLDRHKDWAVIVCLVGGGQEINTGEAGISEWIDSLNRKFQNWKIYISPHLSDSEYGAERIIMQVRNQARIIAKNELHLSVSMRSFRSEKVSLLVKQILDLDYQQAKNTLREISKNYPIVLTRDIYKAKTWLKDQARGTERYGIVVSSQAQRLKPFAIDVRPVVDPIHWFLDGKEDTRSSYYLEDVVTEFQVQGLELDWTCVVWDADFRYSNSGWDHRSFCGAKWRYIRKIEKQSYLKNAYRVLLTRARQGMVIVVPSGDKEDQTRRSEFYDPTYHYLADIGFPEL